MSSSRNVPRLRRERGASTVEVALSMILLIPTMLYSVYVGEAFIAAARAQEAEISASWDITGYRLHDFIDGYDFEAGPDGAPSYYRDVTSTAAREVTRGLSRMDSFFGGTGGRRYVVSFQSMNPIDCRPMDARGLLGNSLLTFQATPTGTRDFLHRGGYVICQASVLIDPQFMPSRLRDGFSGKKDLLEGALATGFNMCGNGTTIQGCSDARRGVIVLTNDWALEDGTRNRVGEKDNEKYFNVGEKVYNARYWDDPDDIAGGIGTQQIKESLQFLLDETDTDYGQTSMFKFGFYNPMSTAHRFPDNDHRGFGRARLSGWEDAEGPFIGTRTVYRGDSRHRSNYLGHPNSNFLDSP